MKQNVRAQAQAGFTLLEVIIALTLLALITAIGFNFFGNPMKTATVTNSAVHIIDNLKVIGDGFDKYYIEHTEIPSAWEVTRSDEDEVALNTIIAEGILKARPLPPSNAKKSSYTGFYKYLITYDDIVFPSMGIGETADADWTVSLTGVTDDVCREVNKRYLNAAADSPIPLNTDGVTGGSSVVDSSNADLGIANAQLFNQLCYNDGTDNVVVMFLKE
jgi:prepilin-type N-terminal cleavage/methylation domain-containing protein